VLAQKKEFRVNPGEMNCVTIETGKITGNEIIIEAVKED